MNLYRYHRNTPTLLEIEDDPIAGGGGGSIHKIIGDPKHVVKKLNKEKTYSEKTIDILIEVAKAINNSNINAPIDKIYDEKGVFIGFTLQYIETNPKRKTLDKVISNSNRPKIKTLEYLVKICKIVQSVHNCVKYNVVITDLKPSNFMIDTNDKIYLVDFDSITVKDRNNKQLLEPKLATIEYQHPILFNKASVNQNTDNFALAVVLYKLISGKHPYDTITSSSQNVLDWKNKIKNHEHIFNNFSYSQSDAHKKDTFIKKSSPELYDLIKKSIQEGSLDPTKCISPSEFIEPLKGKINYFSSSETIDNQFEIDQFGTLKLYYSFTEISSIKVGDQKYDLIQNKGNLEYKGPYTSSDLKIEFTDLYDSVTHKTITLKESKAKLLMTLQNNCDCEGTISIPWSGKVQIEFMTVGVKSMEVFDRPITPNSNFELQFYKRIFTDTIEIKLSSYLNRITYEKIRFKIEDFKPKINSEDLIPNSLVLLTCIGNTNKITFNRDECVKVVDWKGDIIDSDEIDLFISTDLGDKINFKFYGFHEDVKIRTIQIEKPQYFGTADLLKGYTPPVIQRYHTNNLLNFLASSRLMYSDQNPTFSLYESIKNGLESYLAKQNQPNNWFSLILSKLTSKLTGSKK